MPETPLTDAALAQIEARAQAATPGEWFAYRSLNKGWTVQVARGWLFIASDKGTTKDADFIAHAREDVPALIAALRESRERESAAVARAEAAEANQRTEATVRATAEGLLQVAEERVRVLETLVEPARRVVAFHGYGLYGDLAVFRERFPGDWTLPGGPDVHEPLADAINALDAEAAGGQEEAK